MINVVDVCSWTEEVGDIHVREREGRREGRGGISEGPLVAYMILLHIYDVDTQEKDIELPKENEVM